MLQHEAILSQVQEPVDGINQASGQQIKSADKATASSITEAHRLERPQGQFLIYGMPADNYISQQMSLCWVSHPEAYTTFTGNMGVNLIVATMEKTWKLKKTE